MQKRTIAILPLALLAAVGLTAAQSTPAKPPVKSVASSHPASAKPLTAKSAMPVPHKSSTSVPKVTAAGANNSAQLARLEQQNRKASAGKNTSRQSTISAAPKSATSNPPINFQYQKPNTNTSAKKN
jgi:predicted membrane-bound mannosyltransferase